MGRFLWFIPLATAPFLLLAAAKRPVIQRGLLVVLIGVSAWRICKFAAHGAIQHSPAPPIHQADFLTTRKDLPPPPGAIRIEPPPFNWKQCNEPPSGP